MTSCGLFSQRFNLLNTVQHCIKFVRTRKYDIKHPKPGPLERRVLEAISVPIFDKPRVPNSERCSKTKQPEYINKENRYQDFLVKQCKLVFNESPLIAVVQPFAMSGTRQWQIKKQFLKKELSMNWVFNNKVFREALAETKWKNLLPLFVGSKNMIVTANDCDKVSEFVKIMKKTPELVLLGGVMGDRLLSKEGIFHYSSKANMDTLYGELVNITRQSATSIHSLLGYHQKTLSNNLTSYIGQDNSDK